MRTLWILGFLIINRCTNGLAATTRNSNGPTGKPNFILFFMDDLGYGDLGFTGHPTTKTPNLDRLAWNGKILTTWYSGCNVCSGSRASLMTGRQFPRTGMPGVLRPTGNGGLNLNETTIAEHLKKGGYSTAIVGKWHLGQRQVYLPGNRGFDYYLGVPYSDDMGDGISSKCQEELGRATDRSGLGHGAKQRLPDWKEELYDAAGLLETNGFNRTIYGEDPAAKFLPLVYQAMKSTRILEQPLDFTTLAQKYNSFALNFIEMHQGGPFFLYVPFSHVHTTSKSQPERQYAGCDHRGSTKRGKFGDALAESDWIVGNIVKKLDELGLAENTLVLFTSDNGPWLVQSTSGGSEGVFTGRYSGYWDTGKGSNWEGGIREPAFAYWKGTIEPFSRSSEIMSSMDVFPTLSRLAGLDLPRDRVFDGRDATDILLDTNGKSKHDFLFLYGTCNGDPYWSVSAVRHGKYKAHFCTGPGIGQSRENLTKHYDPPLLFDVDMDPSESRPLNDENRYPRNDNDRVAMERILRAYSMEKATFQFGQIKEIPDEEGEGPNRYGVCCDRSKGCNCTTKFSPSENIGILNLGTRRHHEVYHDFLGVGEPTPPRTRYHQELHENAAK